MTKLEFRQRLQQVIDADAKLREQFDQDALEGILSTEIFDLALTYLTETGKVSDLYIF